MIASPDGKPRKSLTAVIPADVLVAATSLLAIIAGSLLVVGGSVLFSRPLWLDEHHTRLLASGGSWTDIFSQVTQGSDFNPPTFFLLQRAFSALGGGADNVSLRMLALVSVWLTLVVVYVILRKDFGRIAGFAGALALWAHPFVMYHAFDARFYGPMLLFTASFAFFASRCLADDDTNSMAVKVGTGLTAALLCTIHYFGIISWMIVLVAAGATLLRRGGLKLSRVWPAMAGPAALLACAPIYLEQRTLLSVPTWVPKVSMTQLRNVLDALFIARPLVVLLLFLIALLIVRETLTQRPSPDTRTPSAATTALVALAFVPLVILVFSIVVQPSMIARYMIPAVLLWAPVIAWGVDRMPERTRLGAVMLLGLGSAASLRGVVATSRESVFELRGDSAAVAPLLQDGKTVVVSSRHVLYKLATSFPPDARLRFFDFDNDETKRLFGNDAFTSRRPNEYIIERDVARIHHSVHGFPSLVSSAELRSVPEFYVFHDNARTSDIVRQMMPMKSVIRIGPKIQKFEDQPAIR